MSNLSIPLYEGDGYLRFPEKSMAPASSGSTPASAELTQPIDGRTVEKQARILRAVVIGSVIERVFNWLDQKYLRARWRDVDAFLAQSTDHADLERRLKQLERGNHCQFC